MIEDIAFEDIAFAVGLLAVVWIMERNGRRAGGRRRRVFAHRSHAERRDAGS